MDIGDQAGFEENHNEGLEYDDEQDTVQVNNPQIQVKSKQNLSDKDEQEQQDDESEEQEPEIDYTP